jgi:hypothetical protein
VKGGGRVEAREHREEGRRRAEGWSRGQLGRESGGNKGRVIERRGSRRN